MLYPLGVASKFNFHLITFRREIKNCILFCVERCQIHSTLNTVTMLFKSSTECFGDDLIIPSRRGDSAAQLESFL